MDSNLMKAVFLGDSFSLDETGCFGRASANRCLFMSILWSEEIRYVLTTLEESAFRTLHLPDELRQKLIPLRLLKDVIEAFERFNVEAIICSDFVANYANWIHFRNLRNLKIPVFSFTHSLSYQRFASSIYQILTAGACPADAILCTSAAAMDVMQKLFCKIKDTLNFQASTPALIPFPLAHDGGETGQIKKNCSSFQVLYLGRLDWQTKADLLVLRSIIKALPPDHRMRFIIAGAADNRAYLELLYQHLTPLGVEIRPSVSEEEKRQLYIKSHVLFSPSDNYQETFGLTLLEAKHYGCVPVVADFDGYRSLVDDGRDGFLLRTVAAPIPTVLASAQAVVSEATYHGWWAAGVSIDPLHTARLLYSLSRDPRRWEEMSRAARQSASQYTLSATARRFVHLIDDARDNLEIMDLPSADHGQKLPYPYQWDFSEIFNSYPCEFWQDQEVILTESGEEFLRRPYLLPQLMLLSGLVDTGEIRKFLFLLKRGYGIRDILERDVAPVVMSLCLKNGLISVKQFLREALKVRSA